VLTFDLDPDPDLPWRSLVETAAHTRLHLHDLGLTSFVKTTGGKGLHVVVPIVPRAEWKEVHAFTERVAQTLAKRDPKRFTASMAKSARTGKVYVDYVRNARSQTAVAAFLDARASGRAGVDAAPMGRAPLRGFGEPLERAEPARGGWPR
jgi:bifunctional non-homologous end joining protein LigD